MTIAQLRSDLGLTFAQFAARLGLASKGQAHALEHGGERPSVRVALELERLSGGRIRAADLNPDVALVEQARGIKAA